MLKDGVNDHSVQLVDKITSKDAIQKIDKATSTDPELNHRSTTETQDLRKICEKLEQQTVALKKELWMERKPLSKIEWR